MNAEEKSEKTKSVLEGLSLVERRVLTVIYEGQAETGEGLTIDEVLARLEAKYGERWGDEDEVKP